MKPRTKAQVIWVLIDIFGFFAIYFFVYRPSTEIFAALTEKAEFIRYDTRMYFCLVGFLIPGHHFIELIYAHLPKYSKKSVYLVYTLFLFVALFGIGMTIKIKHDLDQNGYFYCAAASKHMNVSHFAVYVLDEETCHRLAMEKNKTLEYGF